MATEKKITGYPQKYFLEFEACKHFGIKYRSFRRLIDDGTNIPGRFKVKGTNYYVIEPVEFHTWYSANILEPATNKNKFHNRKIKSKNSKRGSSTPWNKKSSASLSISIAEDLSKTNGGVMGTAITTQGGTTT
jgi:hypothetical protein|tara:strand:+ start:2332 stop:2730 length:399 start_codon:yes stop_codon:yes gene_type:complete